MTLSPKALVAALAAIFVLALVVPPSAATWVHRRRIARAWSEVGIIADRLSACAGAVQPREAAADWTVATGPGNLPATRSGERALLNAAIRGEICGWPLHPDPWGNRYMIGPAWVMSAGPNGILETPLPPPVAAQVAGDDVGKRWGRP